MGRILIVEHDLQRIRALTSMLEADQHVAEHAPSLQDARRALATNRYEVVITGTTLPDGSALDLVNAAREVHPQTAVIVVAAADGPSIAGQHRQIGAFDYLHEPLIADRVRAVVQRACAHNFLVEAGGNLRGNGDIADLSWVDSLPSSFDLRSLLSTVEKALIERTLQATRGAQAEAARRLGLSRSDLSYKLLKYELRKESAVGPKVKQSALS